MEKEELLEKLDGYQSRLNFNVKNELKKDYNMGVARWESFCHSIKHFFETNLPFYLNQLNAKINRPLNVNISRTITEALLGDRIEPIDAFLKSLIQDISSDDYLNSSPLINNKKEKGTYLAEKKAFIVHGHDSATKERTARYLEKLGFEAIILHEQASGGKTIIEKLEHFTDVGFGIVLYTPDDEGSVKDQKDYKPRARQNVVFEHGLLIGKLGRDRVFPLVTDHSVELPGDINGIVYLSDNSWELQLAKEIRGIGYDVDMNKVI